uniref:Uncharacterized protein n=1 Tax=Arundo donax TaxID=35708 RepID=A0A0A9DRF9_ARUDO
MKHLDVAGGTGIATFLFLTQKNPLHVNITRILSEFPLLHHFLYILVFCKTVCFAS